MGRVPASPARAAGGDEGSGPEAQYRLAFEHAPEAIVVAQDGRIQLANLAAERLAAAGKGELVGRPFTELVHPDDLPALLDRYQRRLQGDYSDAAYQFRLVDRQGEVRYVDGYSMPTLWHGENAVLSFLTEVTERERERLAAAETARLFERIAEVSPYFIFVYDYDQGHDVYINRSVPTALGYSPAEAQQLEPYPFEKLCHPEDYLQAIDRDARWMHVPDGAVDVVEFRMRNAAGEWRWFRSINTPFQRQASGRVNQM
ncbi:MAG: PAS domain-containing protein, partial [Myxococcota bacterium]